MKNHAVTYHRVSTADQNPALARDELRRAAAARGLEIREEVEETCSGAQTKRPGLARVLELARRHLVDHVLVWKVDRFGRSLIDILMNVEQLELLGATFVATTQGITISPTSTAADRMQLHMLAVCAEFERTLLAERTLLGLAGATRSGRQLGRPKGSKDTKPRRRPRRSWATTTRTDKEGNS